MPQPLNWGLLSTAKINHALIKPLNASPRTRLLAVGSRSQSTADEYARQWNIPRAHGSYEALLADPEIDVVYNSLPNNLHTEWTIKALRAGKHVLCEKPLAVSLDEVDAMIRAAKETGKVLTEAFMYRHHPQTLKVKEIVDGGAVGQLKVIRGAFSYTLLREGSFRWLEEKGGGSIWDVGCYPISYARMITGEEPLEVFGWQLTGSGGADETFVGQMKFPGGIFCQFDSGFQSQHRSQVEIVGTEGALDIPNPYKPDLKSTIQLRRGDEIETIDIDGQELYIGEVDDMCDAILDGKKPRVSLADSRDNTTAILALLESAESGRRVSVARAG
jgi:D-xylose 1-dehydrogenase (NADP+, D-xylono-1,5-lactone-forming)